MTKLFQFLPALAISAALSFPAYAEDVNAKTVVATVNGVDITLGEMIVARAQLPQQYQQLPADVLFKGVLDQLVQQQLLATNLGDALPQRLEFAIANEMRSLRAAEAVEQVAEVAVTEQALADAYESRYANVEAEQEFNAAHILVESEEEALALVTALNDGADFAELAKEKSTGPSGPNGGDLGWFGKGAMVPEFEAAVLELEKDGVSAPVQTQFGWHVVKLLDTRDIAAPEFDAVRAELEGALAQEAVQSRLVELEQSATVTRVEDGTIDPAVLTNLDLVKD